MKYVVLVSHGTFAPGLKSVLAMLAGGEREDVISVVLFHNWAGFVKTRGRILVKYVIRG